MIEIVTAFGAVAAGLAGCGWIGNFIYKMVFGGEERRANVATAVTGAAKILIDELQEETVAARAESRLAREETKAAREETKAARAETSRARAETEAAREEIEILRRNINQLNRLAEQELNRLKRENSSLLDQVSTLTEGRLNDI